MQGRMSRFVPGLLALLVTACGGGGDGASCDTPLTTAYVDNALTSKDIFVSHNITPSNSRLIHEDGNQGNSYDIDRIILTDVSTPDGDTLAISYSAYATQEAPPGAYMAFYIDADGNVDSGYQPGVLGAEELILDSVGAGGSGPLYLYYTWQGGNWQAGTDLPLVPVSSTGNYYAGCSLGLAIYIPWYEGLANRTFTNARAVMMLLTYENMEPPTPKDIIDSSAPFTFSFP